MTTTALERLRLALEEHGHRVTGTGDQLAARCPAHDDGSPSLSLTSRDGRALLYCHAGCTTQDVLAKLNLTFSDLYDAPLPPGARGAVREHPYQSRDGRLIGVAQRFEPKTFKPLTRNGPRWKLGATEELKTTPYRLPELIAAVDRGAVIYVTEGEHDADTLTALGLAATCNQGGARKWTDHHAQWLKGVDVVVIRDANPAGLAHAKVVVASLKDIAKSVRVMVPPEAVDVTEHLESGRTLDDLVHEPELAYGGTSEPWDMPLPMGWRTGLPAFPVDALPMVLSKYVQAISDEIQTPPDMAGTVALGVQAAAIGGRVTVRVRAGWVEPTNLYAVPVADPASRKSAVVAACRKPLREAEALLCDQFGDRIANLRTQREVLDQYAEALKRAAAKEANPETIEAAQAAVRTAEEVKVPAWPRLVTSDATPEALVTLLAEQRGRIAAISAEAGIFDSLTGRFGKKPNLEPLLEAHAGDEMQVDRRSRAPERVEHPALTLIASIQPYALREMVKRDDFAGRGLLARVLWSLVPDIVGTRSWEVTPAPDAVKVAYRTRVVDLAVGLADLAEPVELRFDERAYEVLGEFAMHIEKLIHPDGELGTGLPRQWAGKLTGAVVRIAGCLHAAGDDDALGRPYGTNPRPISESTIRAAIRLGEYYRMHADAALSPAEDKRTPAAMAVLGVLVKKEMAIFRPRELMRRVPRALQKAGILSEALDYLASLGWVRTDGGKDYELHPDAKKLLTALTEPAEGDVTAGQTDVAPGKDASAPPLTGADTADNVSHDDSFVSSVSTSADSFADAKNTHLPAQTREVSALSAVSAGVRALPDANRSTPRHAHTEGDAPCRDCSRPTKEWVLANRDGRCITCDQNHREAS